MLTPSRKVSFVLYNYTNNATNAPIAAIIQLTGLIKPANILIVPASPKLLSVIDAIFRPVIAAVRKLFAVYTA